MRYAIVLLGLTSCTTVAPPRACPKAKPCAGAASVDPARGPAPPQLDGDFEVIELKPHNLPAAPPEQYLLGPSEREACAFVRLVLSFEREKLLIRYDTLCVDREAQKRQTAETEGAVPLNWCSTAGVALVAWDVKTFSLPAGAATRASVQRILSYAPGADSSLSHERNVWGCKFDLEPQSFEILEKGDKRVRLRAPKYDAEWLLERTKRVELDPDDVISQLRNVLHPRSGGP
jgi:hypothetical protein